jgi:hypothetical protein
MLSYKEQGELNRLAAEGWFAKYRDLLSMYVVDGDDGLKSLMGAYFNQEDLGREELAAFAAESLSEAEEQRMLRVNPDADIPNFVAAYIALFQKFSSQAFLALMNRGALEDIQLLENFSPLGEQQYFKLLEEANGPKQKTAHASATENLEAWVAAYDRTPAEWVRRPNGGVVRMQFPDGVREIPIAQFRATFDKAVAANLV